MYLIWKRNSLQIMEVAIFLYRSIISKKGIRYTDSDYPLWYLQIPLNNIIRKMLTAFPGADPGFQVRGGISCEKSRFYAQKIRFFPNVEGSAKIFGVFSPKKIKDFSVSWHTGDEWRVFGALSDVIDWLLMDFLYFNAAFSNISAISWRPVLVVEEAGVPGENNQ